MSLANRCAVSLAAACGALCAAFGALVLAGWHSGVPRLASHCLPGPPTGYPTGAALLLAGAGLIAIAGGRPRLALPGGAFATAIGLGAVAARLLGMNAGGLASLFHA